MKVIRVDDDRYILSLGKDVSQPRAAEMAEMFDAWVRDGRPPQTLVVPGDPVEYEDRRETDLGARLDRIDEGIATLVRYWGLEVEPDDAGPGET